LGPIQWGFSGVLQSFFKKFAILGQKLWETLGLGPQNRLPFLKNRWRWQVKNSGKLRFILILDLSPDFGEPDGCAVGVSVRLPIEKLLDVRVASLRDLVGRRVRSWQGHLPFGPRMGDAPKITAL